MSTPSSAAAISLSIAAVERDTGLSKDTLRVWERRYGFPLPARDAIGERAYALDQVERLRIVKRLLDAGHRPGRVVRLPLADLRQLAESTVDQPQRGSAVGAAELQDLIDRLHEADVTGLRNELARLLAHHGVRGFVVDVVAPLNHAVGDAWMRGRLQVFEEHLYSEVVQTLLRQALASMPAPAAGRRVLLTTLPGEPHGLGLLMAEAMFALESCICLPLGPQTPTLDIVQGAKALRADIVAIGFAGCLNTRQVHSGVSELRTRLPAVVQLWVGGSAPGLQRRQPAGVTLIDTLPQIAVELRTTPLPASRALRA